MADAEAPYFQHDGTLLLGTSGEPRSTSQAQSGYGMFSLLGVDM